MPNAALELDWPAWVTDDSNIPAGSRVNAKKARFLQIAFCKLTDLMAAVHAWQADKELSSEQEDLLQECFASEWPTPLTSAEVKLWTQTWHDPRKWLIADTLHSLCQQASEAELNVVDLETLFV